MTPTNMLAPVSPQGEMHCNHTGAENGETQKVDQQAESPPEPAGPCAAGSPKWRGVQSNTILDW